MFGYGLPGDEAAQSRQGDVHAEHAGTVGQPVRGGQPRLAERVEHIGRRQVRPPGLQGGGVPRPPTRVEIGGGGAGGDHLMPAVQEGPGLAAAVTRAGNGTHDPGGVGRALHGVQDAPVLPGGDHLHEAAVGKGVIEGIEGRMLVERGQHEGQGGKVQPVAPDPGDVGPRRAQRGQRQGFAHLAVDAGAGALGHLLEQMFRRVLRGAGAGHVHAAQGGRGHGGDDQQDRGNDADLKANPEPHWAALPHLSLRLRGVEPKTWIGWTAIWSRGSAVIRFCSMTAPMRRLIASLT